MESSRSRSTKSYIVLFFISYLLLYFIFDHIIYKQQRTNTSLFTLTGAVANLSPSLLGFLYGQASGASTATGGGTSSTEDLVNLLSNGVCFGYISCAVCFAIAAQSSAVSPSISSTSSNNNSNKAA